jgi:molybdopterin-guanine dinucleotide biosynthesis protein A
MSASGVVLAGGRSTRMKFNKAFAEIGGKSSLQIILDKFNTVFSETIIICNNPELYAGMTDKIYTDVYPSLGPVAGIHSGLYYASSDMVFVLACDIPFIDTRLIGFMMDQLGGYQAVVPQVGGRLQPLAALYSRSCLPVFERCLQEDKLKLVRVFEELDTLIIPETELASFGKVEEIFFNVNDAAALQKAQELAGRLL